MQLYYIPLSLLALALSTAVSAQDSITDIPSCARSAALSGITQTGCSISDLKCVCKDQDWITKLLPDVEKACDAQDLQKTITVAQKFCSSVGVTLTISSAASGSPTSASSSATSASGVSATKASIKASTTATTGAHSASSVSSHSASTSPTVVAATGDTPARYSAVGSLVGAVGLAVGMVVWC